MLILVEHGPWCARCSKFELRLSGCRLLCGAYIFSFYGLPRSNFVHLSKQSKVVIFYLLFMKRWVYSIRLTKLEILFKFFFFFFFLFQNTNLVNCSSCIVRTHMTRYRITTRNTNSNKVQFQSKRETTIDIPR